MMVNETPEEETSSDCRSPSFLHAVICIMGVFLMISLGMFAYEISLHVIIFLALTWVGVQAGVLGYAFADIRNMMNSGIIKALPAIYIFC